MNRYETFPITGFHNGINVTNYSQKSILSNMNTKSITISLSIITGLIGVGLIVNHYLNSSSSGSDDLTSRRDLKSTKLKSKAPVSKAEAEVKPAEQQPVTEPVSPVEPIVNQEPLAVETEARDVREDSSPLAPIIETGDQFPLQLGSKGKRVERLQVWLMRNYGLSGTISGVFDTNTEQQVIRRLHLDAIDEATYKKYRMEKPVHEQVVIK
jgi:hypothetical protein